MCTPAIRALKKSIPDAEIAFLVDSFGFNALKYNPYINEFIVPERKISHFAYSKYLFRIIRKRYDVVIDFQNNPRSALVTFLSGAPRRISFSNRHRNYAYNIKVEHPEIRVYAAISKLKLLQPLGIHANGDVVPDFYISETERKWADELWRKMGFSKDDFVTVVSPISARGKLYKQWDPMSYAALCDFLISTCKIQIIFNWGPGEYEVLQMVLRQMKHQTNMDYEIPSICHLKAVLEKASLFIGCDGGARHIAIAADIPTIGLFGNPKVPQHWTPPAMSKHVIVKPEKAGIEFIDLNTVIGVTDKTLHMIRKSNVD
jgi:ADP-heptose:LPS heptosyltransferase